MKYLNEAFSVFEASGVFLALPSLIENSPKSDGKIVIVIPGFCAGKQSTLVLRYALAKVGYNPVDWKQGVNFGPDRYTEKNLSNLIINEYSRQDRAVSIIGWSLGGLYARALAHMYPTLIDRVVTMGTPVTRDIKSPRLKRAFDLLSPTKTDNLEDTFVAHAINEPTMPLLNFYTKTDGVVDYRDCITHGPNTINKEVFGSHLGLTHNVAVYEGILNFLAK